MSHPMIFKHFGRHLFLCNLYHFVCLRTYSSYSPVQKMALFYNQFILFFFHDKWYIQSVLEAVLDILLIFPKIKATRRPFINEIRASI